MEILLRIRCVYYGYNSESGQSDKVFYICWGCLYDAIYYTDWNSM